MTENSKIGWTQHTLNRWEGCTKIARGCTNCYAEALSDKRYGRVVWGPGNPRRLMSDATWFQYRKWEKRAAESGRTELVFCGSLMDWCDEEAPEDGLSDIHEAWRESQHLLWLMLTKRVERIKDCLPYDWSPERYPNVALGYSIAEPKDLEKMDRFIRIPAARRFISYEPALEWCDLSPWLGKSFCGCPQPSEPSPCDDWHETGRCRNARDHIHQVIIGGESGPKARPFNVKWAYDTIESCRPAGVRVFVKQLGAKPYQEGTAGRLDLGLKHSKGEDPAEWPDLLRVQERIIDTDQRR